MKFAARLLWGAQDRNVPGALGMVNGRVGVVTKGKRMDSAGKPTQVRLRWPDGSHSKWHLIQDVKPPPSKPLSTIAQAMAAVEEVGAETVTYNTWFTSLVFFAVPSC